MPNTLVIVESPAKARTIKKYLGASFEVLASNGHVKDLPKKLGVDVANDFAETYVVIEGKAKLLAKLKSAAKKADHVLIATDPDREGEAIAFHIAEELGVTGAAQRVEFHEITRRGIEQGVSQPRHLDARLYDAQRARRVLDRIVGYDVSALVWNKLAFGLSAGRVQSVALRLIVDREREILAFKADEYWNVSVGLRNRAGALFAAKVMAADGAKLEVHDAATAAAVRADLESASFRISKITRREEKRNPPAPYTTSKLQQDASNILHMPAKRTMRVAQQLYEGVDLKREAGPVGLVTYIRTDSTRVSADAIREVREHIGRLFGLESVPAEPNFFRSKKGAQDAHEAIRPTDLALHPETVRRYLKSEQYRLYKLIYERFVASQMGSAVYDRTSADIDAEPARADRLHAGYRVRASGRVLKSPGWLQAMEQSTGLADEPAETGGAEEAAAQSSEPPPDSGESSAETATTPDSGKTALLPELGDDEPLALATPPGVTTEQKFTQPPPRYNEGSLVRELESRGIGRPSTYAEIISKVQARAYVHKLAGGGFQPTELGCFVVDGLVLSQLDFMDPGFTAQMEEDLDEVGAGKLERVQLLQRFYQRFSRQLEKSKKLPPWKPAPVETDEACEECGTPLLKRWSKNGWFLGCSAYPKCKFTRDLGSDGNAAAPPRETDIRCDKCGKPMVVKTGRFGEFLSCAGYPKCKNARPVPLGVPCPKCGGDLIEIRSRKKGGRSFYGCSNYNAEQKCDFKLWAKPVAIPCPRCGAAFLTLRGGRKPMYLCTTEACGYRVEIPEEEISTLPSLRPPSLPPPPPPPP
jgi:DNA topoisomerase-1